MATLVLQAAGSTFGSAVGGPFGALVGRTLGAVAGAVIDRALFGGGRDVETPRLTTLAGLASTEGAPVPRVYGRARIGGQLIWATRFIETASSSRSGSSGGKGGPATTTYAYAGNFAVGLCEGPIALVRRVWADGRELDLTQITMRLHRGTPDQEADPLIVAKEGAANAPAYRGLAYLVFENMPLADYGNRIPQLSFEVVRTVDGLADMVRAVDLIPGSSEFAYAVEPRLRNFWGVTTTENHHVAYAQSDWTASLDALQALCPNLKSVALVVAWFGDDLRAGSCSIAPRIEDAAKPMLGADWQVAGLTRANARLVSRVDGRPAFGGTPTDDAVVAAIRDLHRRGLSVVFYPFVMMDIAQGNAMPDPRNGASTQAPYPWRGHIVSAAADRTAAVRSDAQHFFGSATPAGAEWSYRRFILHYAQLCASVGGVEGFLVGSELPGLTRRLDETDTSPGAAQIAQLAADAKALLPGAKISYAADWTEYGALVSNDARDIRFPLDIIWSSPAVDFIGLDVYAPLSDWRHEPDHLDGEIARSVHDRDYLVSRVGAGEAFDFCYVSDEARALQSRTPITDGAYGKPWIFRQKDLVGWWSNRHVERVGGVERTSATAFMPKSKPIWFVETGCPAVDLGANAPNVFPDAKASDAELPHFSNGARDDLMQTRALEAIVTRFDARVQGHDPSWNPVSPIYAGRMVDPDRIFIWAYDARPFPAFPLLSDVWTDAPNWDTGHWLNGRLEAVPMDRLVRAILSDMLEADWPELPQIDGMADGYVVDRLVSARGALEPLCAVFGFDATISGGRISFRDRREARVHAIAQDDIVPARDGNLVSAVRADESELPHELALSFTDGDEDYRPASAVSRRLEGGSRRVSETETPLVLSRGQAQRLTDIWLQDLWVARETVSLSVRPGLLALEVGDLVTLPFADGARAFRIQRLADGASRELTCRAVDPAIYDHATPALVRRAMPAPRRPGPAHVEVLDLAIARGEPPALHYLAIFADPWPGSMALWRATGAASFDLVGTIARPALIGETLDDLGPGPPGLFDRANAVRIRLPSGALQSASDTEVLAGRNRLALNGPDGEAEIVAFGRAELVAPGTYRISHLLRGLGGQEALAARVLPAGATAVVLDDALVPIASGLDALGVSTRYRIGPASRDHADVSYVEIVTSAGPRALRPYAPVRARARCTQEGIEISFIRRGRIQADGWEALEIPLGESTETYRIEILSNGLVRRSLTSAAPVVLYRAEDLAADFQGPVASLDCRIVQMSDAVGRGFPLETRLALS